MKLFILTVFCFFFSLISSQDLSDFVISPTEVASFTYGKRQCRIWASAGNGPGVPATQWQFRYDPLFIPVLNMNNTPVITTIKLSDKRWRTYLTIQLDNERARTLAFNGVKEAYVEKSLQMKKNSLFSMPIRSIRVSIPDVSKAYQEVEITGSEECPSGNKYNACYSFDAPFSQFRIRINSPTEEIAKGVEELLPHAIINYEMEIRGTRERKTNRAEVTFGQLKESRFYTDLKGQGDTKYVSRVDLRRAVQNIRRDITIIGVIEDPEKFDTSLFKSLIDKWTTVSTDKFDELSWASTYNGDDLKPEVITKEINKMFIYDEEKHLYKYNKEWRASLGGFWKLIGIKASVKYSYSEDELKHFLKINDIQSEFNGNRIIAKSVDVLGINWSDFEDSKSVVFAFDYLSGPITLQPIVSYIDLSEVLETTSFTFFDNRQPVGVIISFWGAIEEAEAYKDRGFWVCDGRKIVEEGSRFNGQHTPDLRGVFLRGSNEAKKTSGNDKASFTIPSQTISSIGTEWIHPPCSTLGATWKVTSVGNGHCQRAITEGQFRGSTYTIDTVPKHSTVIYLIKVREN